MLADDHPLRMFALNLHLIIGALLLSGVLFVLILIVWTAARAGFWELRRRRAAEQEQRRQRGPDGYAYPPAGRGLCDRCNQTHEMVYYLPSGARRCPACYAETLEEPR
jgi:hypothetical protein